MKRKQLIELLENYFPIRQEEQEYKAKTLEFVRRSEDCFERSAHPGHITASAWLVSKNGLEALLTHHAKLNLWIQLGGHCDGNPDPLSVAIKEAQEESGILDITPIQSTIFDIDVHLIPETKLEKMHYHYDIRFLLKVNSNETIKCSDESHELRWISKNLVDLPTRELSVTRMFDKWLALK